MQRAVLVELSQLIDVMTVAGRDGHAFHGRTRRSGGLHTEAAERISAREVTPCMWP